ncbi:MAG: hypothetical protein M1114_03230 [Candidatus Dependentiae bacterium]|nr:hypothetical protein [Candidatus Dependentiae bacterium]
MTLVPLRTIFLLVSIFCIAGCVKKTKQQVKGALDVTTSRNQEDIVAELEAKLSDIPLPFNSCNGTLLSSYSSAQEPIILQYTVLDEHFELISFYKREMELLGWREVASAQGEISFLMFDKPTKWVAFEIKKQPLLNETNAQELVIFMGQRTDTES